MLRKPNWNQVKKEFKTDGFSINSIEYLEKAAEQLERQINEATDVSTTTKQKHHRYNLPLNILEPLKNKNKAKTYCRTLHPHDKAALNHLTNTVKTVINHYGNKK